MPVTTRTAALVLAGALIGALAVAGLMPSTPPCLECPVCPAGVPQDAPALPVPFAAPAAPAVAPDGAGVPL